MEIATILPSPHLHLAERDDYHMALAHLVANSDPVYRDFFCRQAMAGKYVILDNGVVETGEAMSIDRILRRAGLIRATEIVLPDRLRSGAGTLTLAHQALMFIEKYGNPGYRLMAVPQGQIKEEWISVVRSLVMWDEIDTIGISRFVQPFFGHRYRALEAVPELIESDKDIHLLGCPGDPLELWDIEQAFPGRIRGVDSGIAAIYTQAGEKMDGASLKPETDLDFQAELEGDLLWRNVHWWRRRVTHGTARASSIGDCKR